MMYKIEEANVYKDQSAIFTVWKVAVSSTHKFLSSSDIESLIPQVKEGIKSVDKLLCIRDKNKEIIAFMGVHEKKIEMLFITDNFRRLGLGRKLVEYALEKLGVIYVDVNEQNPLALGFYEKMGFKIFKRSEYDEAGNSFPILHMKYYK